MNSRAKSANKGSGLTLSSCGLDGDIGLLAGFFGGDLVRRAKDDVYRAELAR